MYLKAIIFVILLGLLMGWLIVHMSDLSFS